MVRDKTLKLGFTQDPYRMTRGVHFFGLAVLTALGVPSKHAQILVTDDQMSCFFGYARLYRHTGAGGKPSKGTAPNSVGARGNAFTK